jgi:hypothetical protein
LEEKTFLFLWLCLPHFNLGFFLFLLILVLSVIMSSSPAEYEPPVVPNTIGAAYAQELKEKVRAMVQGNSKDFYPEVV